MATPSEEQGSLVGVLNRVQQWGIAADSKISVITAVQTLACGFLFPELRTWINNPNTSGSIKMFLFIGSIMLVAGIGWSLRALFPTIQATIEPSVTFFGHVQGLTLEQYRERLRGMDAAAWEADYTSQIHINASITNLKFQRIQTAVKLFAAGLAVILFCYVAALAGL